MQKYLLSIEKYFVIPGAKFHPSITTPKKSQVIQKGTNPLIDAYSAFFDNTDIKFSGDTGLRRLVRDSTEVSNDIFKLYEKFQKNTRSDIEI